MREIAQIRECFRARCGLRSTWVARFPRVCEGEFAAGMSGAKRGAHADRQSFGTDARTDRADRRRPVRVRNLLQHFTALSSPDVADR